MTSVPPPPSAQWQLAFLGKLQRLFSEGDFTATYKFALLMALADLAVEQGTDDGSELALTVRQIAERFVQMYWCHAAPYNGMGDGAVQGVLVQNRGTQAAVVSAILQFRARSGARTLQQAKAVGAYAELLSEVAKTVAAQPLAYMQNFGGVEDQFLYERRSRGVVVLKEYVAYCLRRFHPLVQQLARGHWVGHIKANRLNHTLLGDAGDLEDFLSAVRASLSPWWARACASSMAHAAFTAAMPWWAPMLITSYRLRSIPETWPTTLFWRTHNATAASLTRWLANSIWSAGCNA